MNKKQLTVAFVTGSFVFLFSIRVQAEHLKYGEELRKELLTPRESKEVEVSQIEIVTTNVWRSNKTNRISFSGELKNNSDKPIKELKLQLTLFDMNNNIIDRRYDVINGIGFALFPSETIPFEFSYDGFFEKVPKWNKYEVAIVKAYEVESEAEEANRKWKPEDLELVWHRIKPHPSGYGYGSVIKCEIKNNSIYDIDYPPAWVRIYAFDKDNKLSDIKVESIRIPKKESKIFEFTIGREIGQIDSYKISFK